MTSESLSLILAAVAYILAILLSITRMSLLNLSGGTLRKIEEHNRRLAAAVEPYLENRDRYLAKIRVLFVLDILVLIVGYASWAVTRLQLEPLSLYQIFIPAIAALLFLLLTEGIGHNLFNSTSARLLVIVMPLLSLVSYITVPLLLPLLSWHRFVDRRQRARGETQQQATMEDEIRSMVEQDTEEQDLDNSIEEDERRMIQGIFELDETLVREIMTPRVDLDAINADATVAELKSKIVDSGHSRIPIFSDSVDQIIGVIYAKDLLDDAKLAAAASLRDLQHPPVFIPETKNIGDLLAEFQQTRNQFAVVLDEYGGTAGVVTVEDILEEIVGEIRDEYDRDESEYILEVLPEGATVFDTRISIYEVNDALDVELPDDKDYDTLGGYISTELGRIPQVGEVVQTKQLLLEIIDADRRRVLKAKVKKAAADDGLDQMDRIAL